MKKEKQKEVEVISGVCENLNGMRYTKYKDKNDAQIKLDEFISIGVMDDLYNVFKCKDCSTFHIDKNR